MAENLISENKKKIEDLRSKLNIFRDKLLSKFSDYIVTVGLLPASRITYLDREARKINLVVIVNDKDRKKLSRDELKEKISIIVNKLAQEVDNSLEPETILLSEIWYNCLYGNYKVIDVLQTVAPVYDTGILNGLKSTLLHKAMINERFDKFVVSYLILGEVIGGHPRESKTNPERREVEVGIVIDDSGVRGMSVEELNDKLKIIAEGKALECEELTGNKSKIMSKVYLMTELWEMLKEGDSKVVEMLRNGVPIKDNGTFLSWKQLLEKGKIQPDLDAVRKIIAQNKEKMEKIKGDLHGELVNRLYSSVIEACQSVLMLNNVFCEDSEVLEKINEVLVKQGKMEKNYMEVLIKLNDFRRESKEGKLKINSRMADHIVEESDKFINRLGRIY